MDTNDHNFKVLILGNSGVGKTSLARRFVDASSPDISSRDISPSHTIGVDFLERSLSVRGERVTVQLWDTAGQERLGKYFFYLPG